MSTSLSDNNVDMAIFDSYSKTVMRNMSRKKTAVIKKQKNNETGGAEVMQYVMETYGKRICIHQNLLSQMNTDIVVLLQPSGYIKL